MERGPAQGADARSQGAPDGGTNERIPPHPVLLPASSPRRACVSTCPHPLADADGEGTPEQRSERATPSPLPGGEGQGEGSDVQSLRELFGSGHAALRKPQTVQRIAYQVTRTTSCSEVSPWRALSSAASRISLKPVLSAARRISSVELRATIISLISGLSIRISAVTVRPR